MFGNIENLVSRVTSGEIDQQQVGQATDAHVSQMDGNEVASQVQTAAQNAQQNGQPDVAQSLMGIVQQNGTNPDGIKEAAISYIKSNPEVLTHFAPQFAQGILNRVV